MTDAASLLLMALALGLGGSLHCLAMCGPLVLQVPFASQDKGLMHTVLYHTGKATAYGSMGLVAGLVGRGFQVFNWQQLLSIAAGVAMLVMVALPGITKRWAGNFLFSKQLGNLLRNMAVQPKWWQFAALGFLNGFLPCGLVYGALAAATVTTNAWFGFVFMFVFGLGTMPALALLSLVGKPLLGRVRTRLRFVPAAFSVAVALLLILRGLNLGIPYISPHNHALHGPAVDCH